MSYLPNSKWGDCSQCPATDVPCVKVGKLMFCIPCNRKLKAESQIEKAKDRSQVRMLGVSKSNLETANTTDVELQLWFIHRSKEMTGRCIECGGRTTKSDVKYWKFSICHILQKSLFPSVKTHPLNFVELCYFNESHHSNMDNNGYEYVKEKMPKTWDYIVKRFKIMYPLILEKHKIPDILLNKL